MVESKMVAAFECSDREMYEQGWSSGGPRRKVQLQVTFRSFVPKMRGSTSPHMEPGTLTSTTSSPSAL